MDFEEWFDSLELDNWTNKKYMHDAFKAGQQSKQAEIDKRLSDYQLEVSQVGQACVKWKEITEGKQEEIDALKAKIDDLAKWAKFHIEDYNLSESESEHDRGWFNAACQVFKTIRGNKNDT